jgi:prevent-host-death family protein
MEVGIKELKNRLSHFLRRVQSGEVVRVTDRGVSVAELRPVTKSGSDERAALQELEVEGLVTLGAGEFADFKPVRLKRPVLASRIIIEQRR